MARHTFKVPSSAMPGSFQSAVAADKPYAGRLSLETKLS